MYRAVHALATSVFKSTNLGLSMQEIQILDSIGDYFNHTISEVPHDEEEKFEEVLIEAGLTRGMNG